MKKKSEKHRFFNFYAASYVTAHKISETFGYNYFILTLNELSSPVRGHKKAT